MGWIIIKIEPRYLVIFTILHSEISICLGRPWDLKLKLISNINNRNIIWTQCNKLLSTDSINNSKISKIRNEMTRDRVNIKVWKIDRDTSYSVLLRRILREFKPIIFSKHSSCQQSTPPGQRYSTISAPTVGPTAGLRFPSLPPSLELDGIPRITQGNLHYRGQSPRSSCQGTKNQV